MKPVILIACIVAIASAQTKSDIDGMMKELSNWGRWGKDDQKGTINLITPAVRKQAAALVKDGVSVSLSHNTDATYGVKMRPPVDNQFNMDEQTVFFHGTAHTHFDALSHVFHNGQMYNGFPQSSIKPGGAEKLAVTAYGDGFFTRGVLVDIAWLRGVPYLDPSVVIKPADLDAWEKKTGVHIQSGDAVFIRTGRWAHPTPDIGSRAPGLSALSARWLKQRDVAILGSDSSHDALPSQIPGVTFPVHQLLIVAMGMPLFDSCDLEELAKAATTRNRWTFLFTAAPVRATGSTGGPINPIATF